MNMVGRCSVAVQDGGRSQMSPAKRQLLQGFLLWEGGSQGVPLCWGCRQMSGGVLCILHFSHGVGFVLKRCRDWFQFKTEPAYLLVSLFEERSVNSQSVAWLIPDDIIFQVSCDLFLSFGADCYKAVCMFGFFKAVSTREPWIVPAVRKLHKLW